MWYIGPIQIYIMYIDNEVFEEMQSLELDIWTYILYGCCKDQTSNTNLQYNSRNQLVIVPPCGERHNLRVSCPSSESLLVAEVLPSMSNSAAEVCVTLLSLALYGETTLSLSCTNYLKCFTVPGLHHIVSLRSIPPCFCLPSITISTTLNCAVKTTPVRWVGVLIDKSNKYFILKLLRPHNSAKMPLTITFETDFKLKCLQSCQVLYCWERNKIWQRMCDRRSSIVTHIQLLTCCSRGAWTWCYL